MDCHEDTKTDITEKKFFFFFFRRRISNVRALNSRVRKFHGEIIFVAGLFVGAGSLFRRFPDMINTLLFFIRKTHGVRKVFEHSAKKTFVYVRFETFWNFISIVAQNTRVVIVFIEFGISQRTCVKATRNLLLTYLLS